MEKLKKLFIQGSINNGNSKETTNEVFDLILKFANYGFNKAHSVSYAIVAVYMSYLKIYFPAIFFSNVMNSFVGGSDVKFNDYVLECKENNINLLLPSINNSDIKFKAQDKNTIYYSLAHIKGINSIYLKNIIEERNSNGNFTSFENFIIRMSNYRLSQSQIFTLIESGSLDEFNYNRATLKHNYERLEKYVNLISYKDQNQIKLDLDLLPLPKIEVVEEEDDKLTKERDLLGIFISGFPLEKIRKTLINKDKYVFLNELDDKNNLIINTIAIIKKVKVIKTKRNQIMALVNVFDEKGEVSIVLFPNIFEKYSKYIEVNKYIEINGKVQIDEEISIIGNVVKEIEVIE